MAPQRKDNPHDHPHQPARRRHDRTEKAEYIADAVRRALEEAEPGDHPDSEGDNVPSLAPALTLAELDVIEARAGTVWDEIEIDNTERVIIQDRQRLMSWPTAEFIAAARTDVPTLVAALRQAWATNASLRVGWKVDMRKAREAQAELDHIRSELDVQRYHAEHDPCDVCSHLEAVELGELIDRLTLDVLGRTAERDRARGTAANLEAENARLREGIERLCSDIDNPLRERHDESPHDLPEVAEDLRALLADTDSAQDEGGE